MFVLLPRRSTIAPFASSSSSASHRHHRPHPASSARPHSNHSAAPPPPPHHHHQHLNTIIINILITAIIIVIVINVVVIVIVIFIIVLIFVVAIISFIFVVFIMPSLGPSFLSGHLEIVHLLLDKNARDCLDGMTASEPRIFQRPQAERPCFEHCCCVDLQENSGAE